jgi:signal transduction histidine kinase
MRRSTRSTIDRTLTSLVICRVATDRLPEFLQLVEEFENAPPPAFCLEREAWSKVGDPEAYCLIERWADLPSLQAHQASDRHRALLGGIRALGRLEGERLLGGVALGAERAPALAQLVVHDLRNPLAAVSALVSVVEERIAGAAGLEQEAEDLRVARAECRRISRMLSDLLVLSRIERKRLHPHRAATPVRKLLDDVACAIAARVAASGVLVLVEADATVAPLDRELVRRLLDNLAENALRHVHAGDSIQLAAHAEGGKLLRIAVRNTGPEVPARVQRKLFRADLLSDDGAGGTGLGLYVCRLVAEAHAGSISLVTRAGWSVSFEVVLPLGAGPMGAP